MTNRLIASVGIAFCAMIFTACMDGGANKPSANKPIEKAVDEGIATHKAAATDAERLFPKIKVADDAPPEVKAIADAKVAFQRAEHAAARLKPSEEAQPLNPADIRVGQIGTLDFALEVMRVDDDSFVGRVRVGNDSRLYAIEGINTSKLATQQMVSYRGLWHAYTTDKRGLYTVVVLKPAEKDRAGERASFEADNALAKARKEYEAKKKLLDAAREKAMTEAIAKAEKEAAEKWPLGADSDPAAVRIKAKRDHDAGKAKLVAEAKKGVTDRYAELK